MGRVDFEFNATKLGNSVKKEMGHKIFGSKSQGTEEFPEFSLLLCVSLTLFPPPAPAAVILVVKALFR